jgi:hypothetical protein
LAKKEEELENIQAVIQETKEEKPPSIAIAEANIMTKTTLVSSPSLDISQEYFGEFEKHTKRHWFKIVKAYGIQWTRARKEKTRHPKPHCSLNEVQA